MKLRREQSCGCCLVFPQLGEQGFVSSSGAYIRGYIYLGYIYPGCVYLGMACKGWEWHWGSQLCLQPHPTFSNPRHLSQLSQPCPPPGTAFPSRRWDPPGAVPVPLTSTRPQLSQQLWGRAVVLSKPHGWGAVWGRDVGPWGQHSPGNSGICYKTSLGYGHCGSASPFLANQNQKPPTSICGR